MDRDGDGLLRTSRGLGDIRPWPDVTDGVGGTDGIVEDADDECILVYQRLPLALEIRHVSVDANNDAWVGDAFSPFAPSFHKLDGNTGAILASPDKDAIGCGGYGGLVDGNGILWSASRGPLLRYDPATGIGTCIGVSDSYGLGIDTNGFIWHSMWPNLIGKMSPAGLIEPGFPKATGGIGGEDRGVAVTPADNHVWVANSKSGTVSRLDNDGNLLKVIAVGWAPTGVAVDASGKVWVTNLGWDNVMRIDPNGGGDGLGAVDLTVDLGPGARPYNYSDMTGIVAIGTTSPQGIWTVVQDSGVAGTVWGSITWNTEPEGSEPPGSSITVEARAADTEAGLSSQPYTTISNGVLFSLTGQFIEVRATLKPDAGGTSPVLSDIRIQSIPQPNLWAVEYRWGEPAPGYSFADWPIFEGWMDVRIENRGPGDAFNVTAEVMSWPANTTVPDPNITVGDIYAGGSAWSGDTFTTRVDMAHPVGMCEEVFWRIEYDDAAGVHHVVENVPEFPPGEGPPPCP